MKQCKKLLALVLAMVMILSSANLGLSLTAFAAENGESSKSVTTGELLKAAYGISENEVKLVDTYLNSDTYKYNVPYDADSLITIGDHTVEVKGFENWTISEVRLVPDQGDAEIISLENGKGAYNYGGNAFKIEVDYTLTQKIDTAKQAALLGAAAELQRALKEVATSANEDVNALLKIVAENLPTLKILADKGFDVPVLGLHYDLDSDTIAVINALYGQLGDDDQLDLYIENQAIANKGKLAYLAANGAGYMKLVEETRDNLALFQNDGILASENMMRTLQAAEPDMYIAVSLFMGVLDGLIEALGTVANADAWDLSTVKENVDDYAALETLVGTITPTVVETIQSSLKVDAVTLQKNQSMWDVKITVKVMTASGKSDNAELSEPAILTGTVTLTNGATKTEVQDAVDAKVDKMLSEYDAGYYKQYKEGIFVVDDRDELPETLTEDVEYVITFVPKDCTITINDGDEMIVPYGYLYTLPVCKTEGNEYDYTVNGEAKREGTVITISGDTTITRTEGKDYTAYDLYSIIADCFGNTAASNILKSGALLNNQEIRVRVPSIDDVSLHLEDGVLTVTGNLTADASYNGLVWNLYYGADGTENKFASDTASWTEKTAAYAYVLHLTNFETEDVQAVMNLVTTLKSEAAAQMSALTTLYNYYGDMGKLDNITISALKGIIESTKFVEDAEKNEEIKAHFKSYLDLIGTECQALVSVMGSKNNKTLRHYYPNSDEMLNRVAALSEALNGMLPDDTYLGYLNTLFNSLKGTQFEEYMVYQEKIPNLKNSMNTVRESLSAPNAAIDLYSGNIGNLADMLQNGEAVEFETAGVPYIKSAEDTVTDSSMVTVIVNVNVDGTAKTISLQPIPKGDTVTKEMVAALQNDINKFLEENIIDGTEYYNVTSSLNLVELVDQKLNETKKFSVTYEIKTYTVTIKNETDGTETTKTVTIKNRTIDLPKAPAGHQHYFKVNGVEYTASSTSYTFSSDDLKNGNLSVTYTVVDVMTGEFEAAFGDTEVLKPVQNEDGLYVGMVATVDPTKDGIMAFATEIQQAGYDYIGLNGETLMEATDSGLVLHIQTLINAIVKDDSFSSQKLIDIANGTANDLLNATMQLGKSNSEGGVDILWPDLDFTMILSSIPEQMVTLAEALDVVKNHMTFESDGENINVVLDLPEKVYEVYLSAMLAAGYKDNDDLTDVNIEIAYAYLCDVIELLAESDINTTTLQNTMELIDGIVDIPDYDVTKFEPYLQNVKSAIVNGSINIQNKTDHISVGLAAQGQTINTLLKMILGLDLEAMVSEMSKNAVTIKEIEENSIVTVDADVSVINVPSEFEAVVIDVAAIKDGVNELKDGVTRSELVSLINGYGLANGLDYTENLAERLAKVEGSAAVMLLDDIDGDLVFTGTTILDLNGKKVDGSITAKGHLYIIDSTLATAGCGTVTGNVTGTVSIVAGHYPNADVTAFLSDGYKVVDSAVQNALYTIKADGTSLNFVVNTDVMTDSSVNGYLPSVRAMAADIVSDVVLNSYLAASLAADGNVIYSVGIDGFVEMLESETTKSDLINAVLNFIQTESSSDFVNAVIADLLDFGAIQTAIINEKPVATYTLTSCPWTVKFAQIGEGEESMVDFGIVPNENAAKEVTLSLTFVGENRTKLAAMFEKLDQYVEAEAKINIEQPYYANRTLFVAGSAVANVDVDLTSNTNWQTVIAVILAYGNSDKADALVSAIGDPDALKAVFNTMTVEEVFTALKVMSRDVSFADMADSLGVELDAPGSEALEELYHLALCAAGSALERLDITGYTNKTMGMLEDGNTGTYALSAGISKNPDITRRGFTLDVKGVVETSTLTVAIFEDDLFDIAFANMTLANSLAMNFAFEKDHVSDWTDYYVEIVKTYADGRDDVVVVVPYGDQWTAVTINGVEHYYVTFSGIAAKEMTDTIYVTVYNADGEAVSHVWEDSVRDYATRVMATPEYTENPELMTLAVDMLNYGAASQEHFKYNTQDLANDQLTEEQKAMATAEAPETENRLDSDDNYAATSLTLEYKILLNMAFKNGGEGMTATVSFTDHYGRESNTAADLWIDDDGFAIVDIDEIAVADGRQMITVTVYDADGNVYATATDSVEGYIARLSENDAHYDLSVAIMKFVDAAYAFFHPVNE